MNVYETVVILRSHMRVRDWMMSDAYPGAALMPCTIYASEDCIYDWRNLRGRSITVVGKQAGDQKQLRRLLWAFVFIHWITHAR